MATKFQFNGKTAIRPDVYTQVKSGITNPSQELAYGNILIIDTGTGAEFGIGAGIAGTLDQNQNSIYEFDNITTMREELGGGLWWLLASPLFKPYKTVADGVAKIFYIRAAETKPAELSYTFAGGGSAGGNFTLQARYEGLVGNAYLNEVRASAQIKITAAGTGGDTVELKVDGTTIAEYETEAGDNVAAVVAGLIANGAETDPTYKYVNNGGGYFTVTVPRGKGDAANAWVPTLVIAPVSPKVAADATGTAPATFTGGVDGTELVQGFAAKMVAGTIDRSKFKINFYRGTYKGADATGNPYDGVAINDNIVPVLIASSVEFDNLQSLLDWMNANSIFGKYFKVKTSIVIGTGVVDAADLAANTGYKLMAGGEETFSTTYLDQVLDHIAALQYTHVLADQFGDNATSSDNSKILTHLVDEARYRKYMFVGGGLDSNKWTGASGSLGISAAYNTNRVIVCHGGVKKNVNWLNTGYKEYDSLYHAALALGRTAGLPPQVPCTLKALDVDGVLHPLNETEVVQGLDGGVWMLQYDYELEAFAVVQSVNSLQNNDYLINEDGTSHDHTIERISAQLVLEITINAKRQLLGQLQGANRNTLSPAVVKAWTGAYLSRKCATPTQDNIIIKYQDISVTVDQDSYFINFGYVPNGPINKLFFTGFMLDFTV